jgi:hypothetical protein
VTYGHKRPEGNATSSRGQDAGRCGESLAHTRKPGSRLDLDLLEQIGISLGVLDGLRPVLGVDQREAADDLLGLGERPIGAYVDMRSVR